MATTNTANRYKALSEIARPSGAKNGGSTGHEGTALSGLVCHVGIATITSHGCGSEGGLMVHEQSQQDNRNRFSRRSASAQITAWVPELPATVEQHERRSCEGYP